MLVLIGLYIYQVKIFEHDERKIKLMILIL